MYKLDKKQIRVALLNKETELYKNNCLCCPKRYGVKNIQCESCEAYLELREIGDKLLEINKREIRKYDINNGLTV